MAGKSSFSRRTEPRRPLYFATEMSRRLAVALASLTAFVSISCATPKGDHTARPPDAEFLFVSGDSTFWVRSDSSGIRVRASSMLLARYDGRFYEVYVADDDRSFYDAVLVGQRVFRRDLSTNDSVTVFDDRTVPDLARTYAASHPRERPLEPDEEAAEHPATIATTEVDLLDIHGPYLSYEYRADVDLPGIPGSHVTRRGVTDLRTGRPSSLADIFGPAAAKEIVRAGIHAREAALDSVRSARHDERARRAELALDRFRFDERSFALTDLEGAPAVSFVVPGEGEWVGGLSLPLEPVSAPLSNWWTEGVRSALPSSIDMNGTARWRRSGYEVVARMDSTGDDVSLSIRDRAHREWKLGRMGGPARQIYWLDRPQIDSAQRRSLARAFDESAFYGEEVRTAASRSRRAASILAARVLPASRVAGGPPHREATTRTAPTHHRNHARRTTPPRTTPSSRTS